MGGKFVIQSLSVSMNAYVGPVAEKLATLNPDAEVRPFILDGDVKQMVHDAEVFLVERFPVTKEIIDSSPRLEMIYRPGAKVQNVDVPYATSRGVLVARGRTENERSGAVATAEGVLFIIMGCAKKYNQTRLSFEERKMGVPPTLELSGKTLGIIGFGSVGREVGRFAKALNMKVMGIKRTSDSELAREIDFLGGLDSIKKVLGESDFVLLSMPASKENTGMFDFNMISQMKKTSYLINIADSRLVVKEALLRAIDEGVIAGAGLDVYWDEPPDPNDPVLHNPRIFTTPHTAGLTTESYDRLSQWVAEDIQRVITGVAPRNLLNPQAVDLWQRRRREIRSG